MKNAIEKLWYGGIWPWEDAKIKKKEIIELEGIIERTKNDLYERLDKETLSGFKKYEQCYSDLLFFERADAYIAGFSIGVRLVAEAMSDD